MRYGGRALVAWMFFAGAAPFAWAQADAFPDVGLAARQSPPLENAPATAAPSAPRSDDSFAGWIIRSAGVFGFLILMLAFAGVMLSLRLLALLRQENFSSPQFVGDFERLLSDKNYQGAYENAKADGSFLARVLAAGLSRATRGAEEMRRGMQEAGDAEIVRREQLIGYLSLIATLAPLVGLLGTVEGLSESLWMLSGTVTPPRVETLTAGIGTALVTTMAGLIVAILAIVCHRLFQNRLVNLVTDCGLEAEALLERFHASPVAGRSDARSAA